MSFIQVNLGSDVKERECAPEAEYDVRVTNFDLKEKEYEDGGKGHVIHLLHAIEGTEVPYKGVRHYLPLPREGDDKDTADRKALSIKRYCVMMGIPFGEEGVELTDFAGASGTAKLTIEEDETGQYDPQNRMIIPRLKEEDEG